MADPQSPVDIDAEKIPELLPILPLFDAVLFPKMVLPLVVMQGESVQLVDEAMAQNRIIGLVISKKPEDTNTPGKEDLAKIGVSALILKMAKTHDNRSQLLVQGLNRFNISSFEEGRPYLRARIDPIKEVDKKDNEIEALMSNIMGQFSRIVELSPGLPPEIGQMAKTVQEPGTLADMVASTINATPEEKQIILETVDTKQRLKEVTRLVNHQVEILELGSKIQSQVKGDMDKSQREYYLRQQLKAIKEELGEKDETQVELEEYRTKTRICRKKPTKKQNANWIDYRACIRLQPNTRSHQLTWTGSHHCRGTKIPKIIWILKRPEKFWMKITSGLRNPNVALLNFWPCVNLDRNPRGLFCALRGLPEPAKPLLGNQSRGPWVVNFIVYLWVA
jgi:ATP-dependent Lon protease